MKWNKYLVLLCFLCFASIAQAQDQLLILAKEYLSNKDYPKAGELYAKLYQNNPSDRNITEGYIICLIGNRDYKNAEKLLKSILKKYKKDIDYTLLLYKVYSQQADDKKARKSIASLMEDNMNAEGSLRRVANLFIENGMNDYAIEMYEAGKKKSGSRKNRRGGLMGEVMSQALVPFSILALQQSYRKKRGGKKTRRANKH